METIAEKEGVKTYVGSKAVIVTDTDGKVVMLKAAGTRPTMTFAPASNTLKTGTDKEISDEKKVQDAKFAKKEVAVE